MTGTPKVRADAGLDAAPAVLRLQDVHKSIAGQPVLRGLSLTVRQGEVYGLVGPNGSGKSTALRLIAGLLTADAGVVTILGRAAIDHAGRQLALCPQEVSLYRDLTVLENLDFMGRLHGLAASQRRHRSRELVERLGLGGQASKRVGTLSGGWQQRANLAVALVHAPRLLVLDEPTSAVDVEARHGLWSTLESLRADGLTLLLTTHQLDEAQRLCSRVGLLQGGRLAAEGRVDELLARVPGRALAFVEPVDPPGLVERALALGWPLRRYAGRRAALLPHPMELRAVVDALAGLGLTSVAVQELQLEHAYLELLGPPLQGS